MWLFRGRLYLATFKTIGDQPDRFWKSVRLTWADMHVVLLQPKILPGVIEQNASVVQQLITHSRGDLFIAPEYALTGPLPVQNQMDLEDWLHRTSAAKRQFHLPEGASLLINTLHAENGNIYNCCELLPFHVCQYKLFPDDAEQQAGVTAGIEQQVFQVAGKRFQAVMSNDVWHLEEFISPSLDFLVFMFHFTDATYTQTMPLLKQIAHTRNLRILVSSFIDDNHSGQSAVVYRNAVVALPRQEGILNVEID